MTPRCDNCGHPEHLHWNEMCGTANCYCRVFVNAEATDRRENEPVASDKEGR